MLPVAIGQVVAKKYQVDSALGQGGMGVVVAAHHIDLDQKVAIKFLLADVVQHADAAERFRREARAAAKIHSDHVVRVLDVGVLEEGVPFMVMEYLEGRDLGQKMSAGEKFGVEEAVGYALETIDAIGQAHKVGIVHRDLKPANLFLARRPDGSYRIKVLDFGISKSLVEASLSEMRLTSTTTLIGSPLYMSPEQMQSARDVDARADIWSLGAILFEMLAARPPYQANTLPQLCQELLTADPPKLRNLRPDVPEGVEAAVARCLMRNVNDRWQNVSDLAAALKPFSPRHQSHRPEFGSSLDLERSSLSAVPGETEAAPGTLDPWGNTQQRTRAKRKTLGLMVLALLAVCGLAVFLFTRGQGAATSSMVESAQGTAPPSLDQVATSKVVQGAPAAPAAAQAKVQQTIVEPVDSAASEPPPSARTAPIRPQAPLIAKPPAPLPRLPAAFPPTTATSPTAAPPSVDPPSGLSDFGGRN